MDSMEVKIRLKKNSYTVDAVFDLFNTGETVNQWVCVPKYGMGHKNIIYDFVGFEAWVGGRKTAFSEIVDFYNSGDNRSVKISLPGFATGSNWMVKQVLFPGYSRNRIRIRYEALYWVGRAYYWFGSGRHWKNSIEKAVFIIDFRDTGGSSGRWIYTSTGSRKRVITENVVRYSIEDFEPKPGAFLVISDGPSPG